VSDIPTALPSENPLHNVAQMHHVVHMRMHLYLCSLNDPDEYFHYFVPCDYDILISELVLAYKLAPLWWGLTGCLSGAWDKCCA